MADKSSNANRFARDSQSRVIAAVEVGLNALKPIMHFQVSMLRMWADSIERFARNYEKESEKTATSVEERSKNKDRAAQISANG